MARINNGSYYKQLIFTKGMQWDLNKKAKTERLNNSSYCIVG